MKTAVFLNTFVKMKNYDLQCLRGKGVKLVAITSASDYPGFLLRYQNSFDAIYCSPPVAGGIDFEFARDATAREMLSSSDVRIVCQSEDYLLLAAAIRGELGLSGLGLADTSLFRDKVLMKERLAASGIRTPKFRDLSADAMGSALFEELKRDLGLPFVLKPRAMLGAAGVHIVSSLAEFEAVKGEVALDVEFGYEVEEYLDGTLYHCDSLSRDGHIIFDAVCEYTYPNLDFQHGKAIVSMPIDRTGKLAQDILAFNERVLAALGYQNGAAHHELFLTKNGELVFLEIAARSPGALVTPMYRQAFGVSFEDVAFHIEMGLEVEVAPHPERYCMSGILPISEGVVRDTVDPAVESSYKMDWLVKKGDRLPACRSLRDKAATITVWAASREQLIQDFSYLKGYHCLATVPAL